MVGIASFTWGVPVAQGLDFLREFSTNFREAREAAKKMGGSNGVQLSIPTESEMVHTCGGSEERSGPCLGCAVVKAARIDD
jgi:hypothetical protein